LQGNLSVGSRSRSNIRIAAQYRTLKSRRQPFGTLRLLSSGLGETGPTFSAPGEERPPFGSLRAGAQSPEQRIYD
jgi:hypothetical protein